MQPAHDREYLGEAIRDHSVRSAPEPGTASRSTAAERRQELAEVRSYPNRR